MINPSAPSGAAFSKTVIAGIMLAVLAWGTYLAIGGYLAGVNQQTAAPLLRGLVIFGCSVLFLGFWGGMLMLRQRRLAAEVKREE